MTECELLENCGFFLRYQESQDMACRSFIKSYCRGEKMDVCGRKKYRTRHGAPPTDDMMPTGQLIPSHLLVT